MCYQPGVERLVEKEVVLFKRNEYTYRKDCFNLPIPPERETYLINEERSRDE